MNFAQFHAVTVLTDEGSDTAKIAALVPLFAVTRGIGVDEVWKMDAHEALTGLAETVPGLLGGRIEEELAEALVIAGQVFDPANLKT